MPIPEAVIKQAEEAEALHKQLYPHLYKDATAPVTEAQPAEATGTPTEEVTPQPEATQTAPESEQPQEEPTQEQPVTEVQPAETSTEKPPTQVADGDIFALQKAYQKLLKSHEILQNKYNLGKNQEEYRTALDARDTRINNLEAELANLKTQATQPPPQEPPPAMQPVIAPTAEMNALFDNIKADVGEDTADKLAKYFQMVAAQAAQSVAVQAVSPIGQELNAVRQEIDSVKQKAMEGVKEDYVVGLTELCPDWEVIMKDPGFKEYLEGVDTGTGVMRYYLAENRMQALDAEGVAHWYNDYKRSIGLPTTPPPRRQTTVASPRKSKEALITPVSSAKGVTPQPEKPFYSTTQLREMERKIIDLNRTGRLEDAKAIEATINSAIAERRIVP